MPVLPLILAPAALIAPAQQPAVQGTIVEGLILNQAGKPLPASIGLIPMFHRDEPFPARTVENQTVKTKKAGPGFRLPIPAPGLYLLDIRGRGCRPVQVPVLLGEEGLKNLEITPAPEKASGAAKPISSDPILVKLAAMFAAQKEREVAYQKAVKARLGQKKDGTADKGSPLDWTQDLAAIATDLKDGADPQVQSLAAVCYLELHTMMADVDPALAGLALDKLPPTSPWWAFNPRSARGAFTAANRGEAWTAFVEALSKDNPDREVRAYGLYSQAASAYYKGDREKFSALIGTLTNGYKGTKYAKSSKALDPAKMPPPSAAPAEELPSAPAPEAPPVPEAAPAPASPESPGPA
jgi:hypothetical protein